MTQIPWLDKVIYKNRFADSIRRAPGLMILKFVAAVVQERKEHRANGTPIPVSKKLEGKPDFLTRFLDIQDKSPDLPPWYNLLFRI